MKKIKHREKYNVHNIFYNTISCYNLLQPVIDCKKNNYSDILK